MHLLPRELDKLVVLRQACVLAQARLARGCVLSYAEAIALLTGVLLELIRDGEHTVPALMCTGRQILGYAQVHPGVEHLLHEIAVEGTFPDGTKLVTLHDPICTAEGKMDLALYGSPYTYKPTLHRPLRTSAIPIEETPGYIRTAPGDITLNSTRPRQTLFVTNKGDRPVQIGSHYHFLEVNPQLVFDRVLAFGHRLDIPSGTSTRFEPGEGKVVQLVPFGGNRAFSGGNGIAHAIFGGAHHPELSPDAVERLKAHLLAHHFCHTDNRPDLPAATPYKMLRSDYAKAYGPTKGDRIRLGDTSLWIEVEWDATHYGEESVFGGGKTIREGMAQSNTALSASVADVVITNVVVFDYTGIYKCDVGIKEGCIVGMGKAGNPDTQDGVSLELVIGCATEIISGEGLLLTAGAIDTHIHFICPQLCEEALASGFTTLIGGGTGPATGTCATTCTPGPRHLHDMMKATDDFPINIGFTGKGNSASFAAIEEQVKAGALGLKCHEDWGSTPVAIDTALKVAEKYDVQVTLHTDTINESGFLEKTREAIGQRTIHAYHSEGAGGGHAPDIISVCGQNDIIPSSTNPTRPFTRNTVDEHLDMLLVCHHLSRDVPEDLAFAESRIRKETIAAEDVLHDVGAIAIISSDSQAMGRVGESIMRTWATADKMKRERGPLAPDTAHCDNTRAKRYIAKYTINPALAHGISHVCGSIEKGKLADLVLWKPAFFCSKPEMVLKGGRIVYAMMGDANASIPTPQPYIQRTSFGHRPSAVGQHSLLFTSHYFATSSQKEDLGLKKKIVSVKGCRTVKKKDMKLNHWTGDLQVHPERYEVLSKDLNEGKVLTADEASTVCPGGGHAPFSSTNCPLWLF